VGRPRGGGDAVAHATCLAALLAVWAHGVGVYWRRSWRAFRAPQVGLARRARLANGARAPADSAGLDVVSPHAKRLRDCRYAGRLAVPGDELHAPFGALPCRGGGVRQPRHLVVAWPSCLVRVHPASAAMAYSTRAERHGGSVPVS